MFGSKEKDRAFFDAFSRHAETSVEASTLLCELLEALPVAEAPGPYRSGVRELPVPDELAPLAARITAAEAAGDAIVHATAKRLRENWITPLDRADIHALSSRLDDVLDAIEAAADRVALFALRTAPPEARALADVLARACQTVAKAVGLLPAMKRQASAILELCVEINRLESEADALHRRALGALFAPESDPLLVMQWRDVLDNLEFATDCCEDAADVLAGVVLEYA